MAQRPRWGRWALAIGVLQVAAMVSAPTARAQTAEQSAPPPRERPPFPNRVNEVLPDWLKLRAEFRDRVEGFRGFGFTPERDDAYHLTRLRVDVGMRAGAALQVKLQLQDARPFGKTVGATAAPFRDVLNLHAAYVEIGDAQKAAVTARVGRQELSFGEERLIGAANWLNAGRTFDGARVTIRRAGYQLDAFGASVVTVRTSAFSDSSGHGNRFAGVYASATRLLPRGTVQPYVLWRFDRSQKAEVGAPGDLSEATIGGRVFGALPARFDYAMEVAAQTGSVGADTIRASAGQWRLRETLVPSLNLRIAGEYNHASGDGDPVDGRRGTFDQLYPTPHDKLGLADQFGWRNIRQVRAAIDITPSRRWQLSGSYHSSWLADAHDGLYGAPGAMIVRPLAGAPHRHVAQEVDGQAVCTLSPQVRVAGGYAHVFPGTFLKAATPGAGYSYPFIALTYVFLAEK